MLCTLSHKTSRLLSVEETQLSEIGEQIRLRRKLIGDMVGTLYKGILEGDIEKLWLKSEGRWPPPFTEAGAGI